MCYEDMKRDHKENRKESKERTLTPGKGSKSPKCFTPPPPPPKTDLLPTLRSSDNQRWQC